MDLEKIKSLEKESEEYIKKVSEIRSQIEDLRKDCNHVFTMKDTGWFSDTFECEICGLPIRR